MIIECQGPIDVAPAEPFCGLLQDRGRFPPRQSLDRALESCTEHRNGKQNKVSFSFLASSTYSPLVLLRAAAYQLTVFAFPGQLVKMARCIKVGYEPLQMIRDSLIYRQSYRIRVVVFIPFPAHLSSKTSWFRL
ncbi:hypothetical protein M441DRAFT_60875 [Trichoderma asperellum CBS 433.97]|uniref:Uncharacterized protein n=1 Tax=Trichoderma asperellum (strain ATCC 204424 / CBS 433.97 / NBRC 101777) TaxID=1042311 RepID=A0A2T3YYX0_TRIA4|nr:hypothetical protein M441DRAFT_60875 [Trichoderma asperellum CBS 433.97]PTB37714.1 hypothetical protein M441DRAFT_60875 [Trichoderma asperellum CBS 433.97]